MVNVCPLTQRATRQCELRAEARPGRQALLALSLRDLGSVTVKCWNGTKKLEMPSFLLSKSVLLWPRRLSSTDSCRHFIYYGKAWLRWPPTECGRRPEEHRTILYPVSFRIGSRRWTNQLGKTEHSPHWALWEKASVLWRVPLVIQGSPGATAKKDKRSHGQASSQHKTFCATDGRAGMRTVPKPTEIFLRGVGRHVLQWILQMLLQSKIWVDTSWPCLPYEETCKVLSYTFFFKHHNSPLSAQYHFQFIW